MSALNAEQLRAVTAGDGPQLILAGAGTGKTRTIVHRIGWLIAERGIAPHRILAVTFTNKAARELGDRLASLIGDDGGGVVSGTFHAISLGFLRRYADALGYPRDFQVLDADDQLAACRRLLKARRIPAERLHPRYLRGWIEHCKHAGHTPSQAPDEQWGGVSLRELYAAYQEDLVRLGRMDFSDLLLNVVRLFREQPPIAEALRARFDHVLVDEYQDTNPVQHEWLLHLCCGHRNLTVVGDDDQSIYGWRGADVHGILDFERIWPGATVHRLQTNYRSTGAILRLANAVIEGNDDRHPKRLRPVRGEGEPPVWRICHDEQDEARAVLRLIEEATADGLPLDAIAVLYRSNRQSLAIEQALREAHVPYRVVGGVGFFDRMEVKDAIAYWALVQRCADAMHLLRIANKPRRGIGPKGIETITARIADSGLRVSDWLDQAPAMETRGPVARLRPLAEAVAQARAEAEQRPDRGLWPVLERSGYLAMLEGEGEIEAAARTENLRALQGFIEQAIAEGLAPIDVLDRMALLVSNEEADRAGDQPAVSLMTLHRAKGLEFDAVAIVGVEEGLLPHQRAIDEGDEAIAEERRLLYVGITRARERLLLTTARVRRMFGETIFPRPSRFLARPAERGWLRRIEPPAAAPVAGPALPIGARVRHPTFGEGVLIDAEGAGEATRVTVSFDRGGIKRLMLKYAALEIVEDTR